MIPDIKIGDLRIGTHAPCFFIAEAGVNHDGDLNKALKLVDVAREAGASAVKFQTFRTELVASAHATKAKYQIETTGHAESQADMIRKLELSPDDFQRISEHCSNVGILFLSTAFDIPSADVLRDLNMPAFKIPSGEITNKPLLQHIAKFRLPILISTGMADMDEVAQCMAVVEQAGSNEIALFQCTSNYPANPAHANLRTIVSMREAFNRHCGYSDHTIGIATALAAVALGAAMIEKHFTLDSSAPGPDHRASIEPNDLKKMIEAIREVEAAMGDGVKKPVADELDTKQVARRSLFAAKNLAAGHVLGPDDLIALRPGDGISPMVIDQLLGRTIAQALPISHKFTWDDLL